MMSSEIDHGEDWQNNLDRWREKRRQQVSQRAKLVENSRKAEEEDHERRVYHIRDNFKRIQKQRVSLSGLSSNEFSDCEVGPSYQSKSENNTPSINSSQICPFSEKENQNSPNGDLKFSQDRPFIVRKEGHALKVAGSNTNHSKEDLEPEYSPKAHHEPDKIEIENDKIIESLTKHIKSSKKPTESLSSSQASEDEDSVFTVKKYSDNVQSSEPDKSRFLNFKLMAKPGMNKDVHWGITLKSDCDDPIRRGSLVRISGVKMGSSADLCELKKGDILISINGKKLLDSSNSFLSQMEVEQLLKSTVADSLVLTIRRNNDEEFSDQESDENDETEVPRHKDDENTISDKTLSTKISAPHETDQKDNEESTDSNASPGIVKKYDALSLPKESLVVDKVDPPKSPRIGDEVHQDVKTEICQDDNSQLSSLHSRDERLGDGSPKISAEKKIVKLTEFNLGFDENLSNLKKKPEEDDEGTVTTKHFVSITDQKPMSSYDVRIPPKVHVSPGSVYSMNGLSVNNYDSKVVSVDSVNNKEILMKNQKYKDLSKTPYKPAIPLPTNGSDSSFKENHTLESHEQKKTFSLSEKERRAPVKKEENYSNSHFESPPLPPRSMPRNYEFFDGIKPYKKPFKNSLPKYKEIASTPPRPKRNSRRDSDLKICNACENDLGTGALMIIQSLNLYYHLDCFRCCSCFLMLCDGNSDCEVRIKRGNLYCNKCYANLCENSPHNSEIRSKNPNGTQMLKGSNNEIRMPNQSVHNRSSHNRNGYYAGNKQKVFQDHLLQPYRRSSLQSMGSGRDSSPSPPLPPPHTHLLPISRHNELPVDYTPNIQVHSRSFVGYF